MHQYIIDASREVSIKYQTYRDKSCATSAAKERQRIAEAELHKAVLHLKDIEKRYGGL